MSVINAFLATWSSARLTYGEGTPQPGAEYDNSGALRGLESDLGSAAPGSRWSGSAASNYDAANTEHRRVIGELADLDRRLAVEVDNSAQSVDAGRRNLENLRTWVVDAAASVPAGQAGERMRMVIAQKGLAQLREVMQQSNAESNAIGGRIRVLEGEFRALGNQKFGVKEGIGDSVGASGDEVIPEEASKRAEQDVQDALAGDVEAAGRVDQVLGEIEPGKSLTPEQGSYLSQMQAQQHGMSVDELTTAEQRLGDHKNIVGDSWQLMSNQRVSFPRTELQVDALDDPARVVTGGSDQLPRGVQDAVNSSGLLFPEDTKEIADIVRNGDQSFQVGTEIDRDLLNKADRMMDTPLWETPGAEGAYDIGADETVQDIFTSAGRDHQVVHDHILGLNGADGNDFLHDVNRHGWPDDGAAAGSMFSWTEHGYNGPEAELAARTAEKVGSYLGAHDNDLMNLPGEQTLGEVNPVLVQAYAHGLAPYMPEIAGLSSANPDTGFGPFDSGKIDAPTAKGIFSVLSTDEKASDYFNGVAHSYALANQVEYAEAVKTGAPNVQDYNAKLFDAAKLQGLVETGTANAAYATDLNDDQKAAQAYQRQESAYNAGVKAVGAGLEFVPKVGGILGPGAEILGDQMKASIIGPPPTPNAEAPIISNMGQGVAAQQVLNSFIARGVELQGVPDDFYVPVDPNDPSKGVRIGTVNEIQMYNDKFVPNEEWRASLDNAVGSTVGEERNPVDDIAQTYEDIVKKRNP